jgi:hypothetical protein
VSQVTRGIIAAGAVAISLFAVAFWVAPRSCDGGLEFYFWYGVAALVVMLALPFVLSSSDSLLVRVGWALGFAIFGAGAWLGGLFAANVRIICRLF